MIPLQVLKGTPFIQSLESEAREEGLEEGREVIVEMLLHAISNRFPRLDLSPQIERVHDVKELKQLFFDLDLISDEDALSQRLV